MAKGGRAIVEKSRRRISKWNGDEDEEDDEYIAEEEEELESESYDESLSSSSDSEEDGGEFGGNLGEFSESDGSVEEDSDFELDESEFEEEDEIRVKRSTKGRGKKSGKGQTKSRRKVLDSDEDDEDFDVKPVANQNRRKQSRRNESDGSDYEEEEDDDFDDFDEEEEGDEDEDFNPDVDYDDEESVSNSKRKNGYRKKRASSSRSPVKRRKSKKPKVSRRKKPTGTKNKKEKKSRKKRRRGRKSSPKEPATKRKRRSAQIKDDDFIVDDDDDFIMEDRSEVKTENNKRKYVSDSDTSEFEFITSDEDDFITEEQVEPKKRKKHKVFCSGSGSESDSSDSDFVVYEEEEVVKEGRKRKREDVKGKEKEGEKEEDSGKKVCGICLSEEQRRTTRGVLECCAHFFCFACIIEWSKVESRCPVCKRRFEFITKASSSDADDLEFGAPRKVIKVPKRDQVYQPSEEDIRGMLDPYENVVCMECQQGGDDYLMLLCDICDSSAHTYCVGLGHAVPEGNWYCDCCRSASAGVGPSNLQPQPSVGPADPAPTESDHSINLQPRASSSSIEIDLNAPPRDNFEEAGTQCLGGPSQVASPSTGGAATLSNRRHIQNRIRILLSNTRPMQVIRRNREENAGSNGVRFGLRVGRSSGQQGSILAPHGERGGSHEADKAKEQLRSMVKNHLKQLSTNTSLDRDAFRDVARKATYTVLSVCGFAVEHRNLVSSSISAPTGCCHEIRGSEQASLLAGSCSACFDSFVGHVVATILNLG